MVFCPIPVDYPALLFKDAVGTGPWKRRKYVELRRVHAGFHYEVKGIPENGFIVFVQSEHKTSEYVYARAVYLFYRLFIALRRVPSLVHLFKVFLIAALKSYKNILAAALCVEFQKLVVFRHCD